MRLLAGSLLTALPVALLAQSAQPHTVRGLTVAISGGPVAGAKVSVLESLDSAATDAEGRFTLRIRASGSVTLVAHRIGFAPATLVVPVDTNGTITLTMHPQAAVLVPISVQAGAYTAGNERGMTLTSLEVVTIPGATADVARAMQTLPGVQNVDEGTGLFVRGGDVSETRILLDNAVMLSPYNYETPTGNYTVTVNPFLLDGIFFSSGGFGARYGNILSGVADLRTQGRPARNTITAVAGLASVSTAADFAFEHGLSAHVTAARNDTEWLFKLNGETRSYIPAPNGNDISGSVVYNYRPTAEIKTFAIARSQAVGISASDPSSGGGYSTGSHSSMIVTGWKDVFGSIAPELTLSYSAVHRNDGYGVFGLENVERWSQLFTQTAWTPADRVTLRLGGDLDWRDARFIGTLPESLIGGPPDSRFTKFDSRADGGRNGAFTEADWRALEDLRLIVGLRTDHSTFTHERTVDPRLSAAYRIGDATLTAAAGQYHQVSDPLYFAESIGRPGIGPMGARQYVLGGQLGEDRRIVRVEVYDKRYRDLVGLTRDKIVEDGGTGSARGLDAFLRRPIWPYASVRLTYSYVDARRTDPNTGLEARAPFDVTHSMTFIFDQELPKGWSFASAFRHATGKPFTPVIGASPDAGKTGVWIPRYGASYSDRLPAAEKFDLSLSRVRRLNAKNMLVYFFSLDNVFDRENIYTYVYTADYSRRIPIRSVFKRSFYIGASLTHVQD
jgi:vitamin B12 transporter